MDGRFLDSTDGGNNRFIYTTLDDYTPTPYTVTQLHCHARGRQS
jgi:hypothetical protein